MSKKSWFGQAGRKVDRYVRRQIGGTPHPPEYQQIVPEDLKGFRQGNIDLFNSLLSGGGMDVLAKLGLGPSPLQRQSTDALSHYLNMPSPEQQALNTALPSLQNILGGRPGQGIIDALQPSFERNLAVANQQGGRFGSGNAILRSRAVDDFNLLGAQAAQQGQQTQLQASQILAMLSGQAGQNPFQRMLQAGQFGQAGANDQQSILLHLLGIGQQGAFNSPFVQTRAGNAGGGWEEILKTLGPILGVVTGNPAAAAASSSAFDPSSANQAAQSAGAWQPPPFRWSSDAR